MALPSPIHKSLAALNEKSKTPLWLGKKRWGFHSKLACKLFLIMFRNLYYRADEASLTLEALAVHNRGSTLIILLLGDPHLLEGGQRSQDRATNPDGILALRRCDDLDLHG